MLLVKLLMICGNKLHQRTCITLYASNQPLPILAYVLFCFLSFASRKCFVFLVSVNETHLHLLQ